MTDAVKNSGAGLDHRPLHRPEGRPPRRAPSASGSTARQDRLRRQPRRHRRLHRRPGRRRHLHRRAPPPSATDPKEHHVSSPSSSPPSCSPPWLAVRLSMKLRKNEQAVAVIGGTVGVPSRYFPVLAGLELAGAAGIIVGLWVEWLGIPAAAGLVAYFVGAVTGHLRVGDTKNLSMPLPPWLCPSPSSPSASSPCDLDRHPGQSRTPPPRRLQPRPGPRHLPYRSGRRAHSRTSAAAPSANSSSPRRDSMTSNTSFVAAPRQRTSGRIVGRGAR